MHSSQLTGLDTVLNSTADTSRALNDTIPDGVNFAELLERYTANSERFSEITSTLKQTKADLEAQAIEIIMRRVTGNLNSRDARNFAGNFQQSLAWMSQNNGTRMNFVSQLEQLSFLLPEIVNDIVNSLTTLQGQVRDTAAAHNDGNATIGAFSQVTAFSLTQTSAWSNAADTAIADFFGVNRVTVKMQIQMQMLKESEFSTSLTTGDEGTSISLSQTNIELRAYLAFIDPLVLDLGGDGIELKSLEEDGGVVFDLAGDGSAKRCGFVKGNDALLFLDNDGDGLCGNGRELFGDQEGDVNGFAKLSRYDRNGDGIISDADDVYENLKVWTDLNGDGQCTHDEVKNLREAGVASIDLNYASVAEENNGNLVSERGSYTALDGTVHETADARFRSVSA